MAVIASVIGAGGLGDRVYQALASVDVGAALAAGIPIVLLAVVLDRTTAAAGERIGADRPADRPGPRRGWPRWAGVVVVTVGASPSPARLARPARTWPDGWTVDIAEPGQPGRRLDDRPPLLRRARRRRHRRLGRATSPPGSSTRCATGCRACPGGRVLLLVAALGLADRHLAHRADRRPRHGRDRRARRVGAVAGHPLPGARGRRRHPRPRLRRSASRRPAASALERLLRPGARRLPDDAAVRLPDPGGRAVRRRPRPGGRRGRRLRAARRHPHHHAGPARGRPGRAGVVALARRHRRAAAAPGPAPAGPARAAARRQPGRGPGARRRRHRRPGRRRRARLRRRVRPRPGRPGDRPGRGRGDRLPRPDARPGHPADRAPHARRGPDMARHVARLVVYRRPPAAAGCSLRAAPRPAAARPT